MFNNFIFFLKKILRQFYHPTRYEAKYILDKIYFIKNIITFKKNNKSNPVYICDLRCTSPTFDFLFMVCEAFLFFSKKGFSSFDLIIYWPKDYKFKAFKRR